MLLQTHVRGHINQTKYAYRTVPENPAKIGHASFYVKLQKVVNHNIEVTNVIEKIGYPGLDQIWCYVLVTLCHRSQYGAVEGIIKAIHETIVGLKGITFIGWARYTCATAQQCQSKDKQQQIN
jgi:hypothetical protein